MNSIKILFLTILFAGCFEEPEKIECESLVNLKENLILKYDAEKIEIRSRIIKQEIYFDRLKVFQVTILNATTSILDFKELSSKEYSMINNYEEVLGALKNEGRLICELINEDCNLDNFTNVSIMFAKENDKGKKIFRFGNTYEI